MPIQPASGPSKGRPPSPRPAAAGTLKLGSSGPRVTELQTTLRQLGFYAGEASGKFDQATEEAVKNFQIAVQIKLDGVVGPTMREQLARLVGEYLPSDSLVLQEKPAPGPEIGLKEQEDLKANMAWLNPERAGIEDVGGIAGRRIERDSRRAGASWLKEEANQKRLANTPLIKRKLDMLQGSKLVTPEERQQYEAILGKLAPGRPHGVLAWQTVLLESPERALKGAKSRSGETTLQALNRLASGEAPLHEKIDRLELLEQLVVELAVPSTIEQESWGTCAATTIQMRLAKLEPAEYVALVLGLASPEGKVKLPDGSEVTREPGTELPDTRTISTRLMTPMLMEVADGPDVDYDNAKDEHSDTKRSGLSSDQINRVEKALSQREFQTYYASVDTIVSLMARIQKVLEAGQPQSVSLAWGARDAQGVIHGAHAVLVTAIRDQRVYYDNPWGQQESMPLVEFQQRLLFINQPKEQEPAPAPVPDPVPLVAPEAAEG